MNTTAFPRKTLWRSILALMLVVSMLASASVMCFASTTATQATEGITDVSISLSEDIVVKFYTNGGAYLVVVINGKETVLETSEDGVFQFVGVTPRDLNDTMSATLYDANDEVVGETKEISVKTYLETLLSLDYENSGCASQLQYQAMKELAVNLLNYGAAAQTYVNHDTENLANKDLTPEQQALATASISVTDTDKAAVGSAWVGAGVRFDSKLGLYFVFKAETAEEYTVTVNGAAVTPEAYTVNGVDGNCFVVRYNDFNATNMNDVVTAKLTKDGADDQTFAYSIKSYVASKGGESDALAALVNATYVYGFAAVAYSAEYEGTAPTLNAEGSLTIVGKGYDFSGTAYGETVTLPVLNLDDYTTVTAKSGDDATPTVTTTFTLNNGAIVYSTDVTSDNCIEVDGKLYSQYDLANATVDGVEISYDAETGYTYAATEAVTLDTPFMAYGADLTITGTITVTSDNNVKVSMWVFNGINVNVGTATATANITATGSASDATIKLWNNASMTVSEGSTLNLTSNGSYAIYLGDSEDPEAVFNSLVVDGTVTTANAVACNNYLVEDANGEYGMKPAVYVRKGTLNCSFIKSQTLQVGSEKYGYSGNVTVTTITNKLAAILPYYYNKTPGDAAFAFAKGSLDLQNTSKGGVYMCVQATENTRSDLLVGKDMSITASCPNYVFANTSKTWTNSNTFIANGIEGTFTKFLFINEAVTTGTSKLYNYDVATVTIGDEEHTVRIFADNNGAVKVQDLGKVTLALSACQSTPIVLEDGTVLTATGNTATLGILGEFAQATAGAQTIWYQIID
ncbi:MAG: hypothetical protein IJX94_05455 [Clostridia bacterium]|nr:hypothetical protein [Clostridia bacterium]